MKISQVRHPKAEVVKAARAMKRTKPAVASEPHVVSTAVVGPRDGFEIVLLGTDDVVVHFVECMKDGSARERVASGLVRKTDGERFFVRDTRSPK